MRHQEILFLEKQVSFLLLSSSLKKGQLPEIGMKMRLWYMEMFQIVFMIVANISD